jgi:hypothetical protein
MSATEVRLIPKQAEVEYEMKEVNGDHLELTEIVTKTMTEKVKPVETSSTETFASAQKIGSTEDVREETKTITVDLADAVVPTDSKPATEQVPGMVNLSKAARVTYREVEDGWVLVSTVESPAGTLEVEVAAKSPKVKTAERSKVVSSGSSSPSLNTDEASAKPKPKKVRTVQFAEGTTLPIIDVTPKPEKKVKTDPQAKGPVQMITDTMQVLKRYENEFRGAQAKIHEWEQKRIMLTLEGMWKSVVYTQCAVMLGMLAVILAMVLKA